MDVLKIKDTQFAWSPHMGGIQVAAEWEVHVAPLGIKIHDGAFGACPKGWSGFPSPLCVKLQPKFDYGPLEGGVRQEMVSSCGLKFWIRKIVYQQIDVSNTY